MEPRFWDDGSTQHCLGGQPEPASGPPLPPPPSRVSSGSSPSRRRVGAPTGGLDLSAESPCSAPSEWDPVREPQSIIGTPQPCPALGPAGPGSWETLQFHEDWSWPQRMSPHWTRHPKILPCLLGSLRDSGSPKCWE